MNLSRMTIQPLDRERRDGGRGERGERGGRGGRSSRVLVNQSSTSPSAILGRRATQERVIVELKLEVEALRDKCSTYQELVAELRSDLAKVMVKGCTKKSIRQSMRLSEVDERYGNAVSKLCKEWLFPRFKFLHKHWMDYTEARKGLPRIIFERCPLPAGSEKLDMWNRVVTLTVARNYATIRRNINNSVEKAFKGEFCSILLSILIL